MPSFTERLGRHPVGRPFAALLRTIWRPLFGLHIRWQFVLKMAARADLVCACPDWDRLPRVKHAGRLRGFSQIMHNGLRVRAGSFYGLGSVFLFRRTGGVHEPQEEIVFAAVLPLLPPGAVMVELGSSWAFYSMWFAQQVPGARNYLVEPDAHGMKMGRANFARNGFSGDFTRAFVGSAPPPGVCGVPAITLDAFCTAHAIERLHLLHADIQGVELEMLEGARTTLAEDRVDFLFLSTHDELLHAACRAHLAAYSRLRVFVDVPPAQSYSVDGLLVAARAGLAIPDIHVSLRDRTRLPAPPGEPAYARS